MISTAQSAVNFRKLFVVIQFSCAGFLIIATLGVYKQLQFIKNRPNRMETSGLVQMPLKGQLFQKYDVLKCKLLSSGAVLSMCNLGSIAAQNSTTTVIEWPEMSESDKNMSFNQIITTSDLTRTMGIRMISGRDFDEHLSSDAGAVLLSRTAVQTMALKNPVGSELVFAGAKRTFIGVFNYIIWADASRRKLPIIVAN